MSVCGNRTDSPGFFTSCQHALNGACICGAQLAEELITHAPPLSGETE